MSQVGVARALTEASAAQETPKALPLVTSGASAPGQTASPRLTSVTRGHSRLKFSRDLTSPLLDD